VKKLISSATSISENISTLVGTAAKILTSTGCLIMIFYFLRIGYFPQGLSLGDGILFLTAAFCFGAIYTVFIYCMMSFGIVLSPIFGLAQKFIFWLFDVILKSKTKSRYAWAPFTPSQKLIAIPGALLLIVLAVFWRENDKYIYITLILSIAVIYLCYSIALDAYDKYRNNPKDVMFIQKESENHTESENKMQLNPEKTDPALWHKRAFRVGAFGILIFPLIISGAAGPLLDGAMRLAQIRIEKPILHINAPYSDLLPSALKNLDTLAAPGFTVFNHVTVLSRGVGNATVIAFDDHDHVRRLAIPNDQIIVETVKKRPLPSENYKK